LYVGGFSSGGWPAGTGSTFRSTQASFLGAGVTSQATDSAAQERRCQGTRRRWQGVDVVVLVEGNGDGGVGAAGAVPGPYFAFEESRQQSPRSHVMM